jgi:hypothetical protein
MLLLCLSLLLPPADLTLQAAPRERAFWVAIVANKYDVPAGEKPFELLVEMDALLGSTDPVLRDDVAYGAAANWIVRRKLLTPAQQKVLLDRWLENLTWKIGERDTDAVFRRSFSALNLSILASQENQATFLTQPEFDRFVDRVLTYLADERDTRGFDRSKGWMHSPAHTADVLKFLARNPKLTARDQARMLTAVSSKANDVGHTFAWGEDERLAQVVRSLVRRTDLDPASFDQWLEPFPARSRRLWANGPTIDPDAFPPVQNIKLILRAAFAALSADADLGPGAERARQQILKTLAGMS